MINIVSPADANVKLTLGLNWFECVIARASFGVQYGAGSGRPKGVPGGTLRPAVSDPDRERKNRERAIRRAKAQVRRKVKSMADKGRLFFLTATYKENMQDLEQFKRDFEEFVRRVRKVRPDFKYVAVTERQKRGAWHVHLITNIRLSFEEWTSLWGHGFIWIATANNTRHAVRYITKYLMKTFGEQDLRGMHRYFCSQGIGDEIKYVYAWATIEGIMKYLNEYGDGIKSIDVTFTTDDFDWFEGVFNTARRVET